jgi:predicted nucleic acid-binding protein
VVTYVLDASAVLRFIDHEAGVERLSQIFEEVLSGQALVVLPAVHYGEVIGISFKRGGESLAARTAERLRDLEVEIIPADAARSAKSAIIHTVHKIPYADSFAVELATDSAEHRLITADFDFIPAQQLFSIEFLPRKS